MLAFSQNDFIHGMISDHVQHQSHKYPVKLDETTGTATDKQPLQQLLNNTMLPPSSWDNHISVHPNLLKKLRQTTVHIMHHYLANEPSLWELLTEILIDGIISHMIKQGQIIDILTLTEENKNTILDQISDEVSESTLLSNSPLKPEEHKSFIKNNADRFFEIQRLNKIRFDRSIMIFIDKELLEPIEKQQGPVTQVETIVKKLQNYKTKRKTIIDELKQALSDPTQPQQGLNRMLTSLGLNKINHSQYLMEELESLKKQQTKENFVHHHQVDHYEIQLLANLFSINLTVLEERQNSTQYTRYDFTSESPSAYPTCYLRLRGYHYNYYPPGQGIPTTGDTLWVNVSGKHNLCGILSVIAWFNTLKEHSVPSECLPSSPDRHNKKRKSVYCEDFSDDELLLIIKATSLPQDRLPSPSGNSTDIDTDILDANKLNRFALEAFSPQGNTSTPSPYNFETQEAIRRSLQRKASSVVDHLLPDQTPDFVMGIGLGEIPPINQEDQEQLDIKEAKRRSLEEPPKASHSTSFFSPHTNTRKASAPHHTPKNP